MCERCVSDEMRYKISDEETGEKLVSFFVTIRQK